MSEAMWMLAAWVAMAAGVGVYGWVWGKAAERGRRWLEWGLAAVVAAVSLASVATHEPFADEVHAWLQARDMTVGELWREMAFEGHFVPWHLLLHPLARWGAPLWTMGVLSWALNTAAVAWFARRAPLGGGAKAAALLSCVFLYVNPVISRCYALVPLALSGMASLWGRRDERPVAFGLWVALLANTHVYLAGTAGLAFLVFARENVLRRNDGKSWRECGKQWAGLGTMAAGGALALAQVLPSLWKSAVPMGQAMKWTRATMLFGDACNSSAGIAAALAGLVWLGAEAWKRDRSVFWVLAGSLAYMWGFAVFVYPATVINRTTLWWPVALFAAWALGEEQNGRGGGVGLAVAAMGLALMRPEMTWRDWKREYDPLPGVCRWIEDCYGKDAEVWINGGDFCAEAAAAHLDNVMDWRTGEKAELISWSAKKPRAGEIPFEAFAEWYFREHPDRESCLVLGSMTPWSGLTLEVFEREGVTVELSRSRVLDPKVTSGEVLFRVERENARDRSEFWVRRGMERLAGGDRDGAAAAWERAVEEDPGQWGMMNNLAWLCAEEGRTAEARSWMDRAMANESARKSPGAWDTEAAVRRAEGDEAGAREAEETRDALRNATGSD